MEQRDKVSSQLSDYARSVKCPHMATASNGCPIDTLTASQTAGSRGPITLQDFALIDHLASFDRERIPERVVHARGFQLGF
jgi:catalase